MTHEATVATQSVRSVSILAAACLAAAIVLTVSAATLTTSAGIVGTVATLAVMWVIAITEVVVWLRVATAQTLGLRHLRMRDAAIAIGAGIVLMLLVPILSLGANILFDVATGTVEASAQLNVGIATAGVVTAAATEEVIYRAGAMSALIAIKTPKWITLVAPALLFAIMHWSWGLGHMTFVAFPLGLALGALFLWRRNLLVNVIAHLIIDIPVIVLAATGGA